MKLLKKNEPNWKKKVKCKKCKSVILLDSSKDVVEYCDGGTVGCFYFCVNCNFPNKLTGLPDWVMVEARRIEE